RLTGAGLAVRDLRELRDVDEAADAEHAAAEAPDGRFAETLARLTGAAALR
ncbi:glycosyltransferase, partial [Streptomyces albidoflavus]